MSVHPNVADLSSYLLSKGGIHHLSPLESYCFALFILYTNFSKQKKKEQSIIFLSANKVTMTLRKLVCSIKDKQFHLNPPKMVTDGHQGNTNKEVYSGASKGSRKGELGSKFSIPANSEGRDIPDPLHLLPVYQCLEH
jgi:hypothetical protein